MAAGGDDGDCGDGSSGSAVCCSCAYWQNLVVVAALIAEVMMIVVVRLVNSRIELHRALLLLRLMMMLVRQVLQTQSHRLPHCPFTSSLALQLQRDTGCEMLFSYWTPAPATIQRFVSVC